MNVLRKIRDLLRGKPLTAEELAERAEAKQIRAQMLSDRASQKSGGAGQFYRSKGK